MRKNKLRLFAFLLLMLALFFFFWPRSYNTRIALVTNHSVYVKDFPHANDSMLRWWNKNKASLQTSYNLPPQKGYFSFDIMDFGNGYESLPHEDFISGISEDDYLCFDPTDNKSRCIKKKILMSIMGDQTKKIYIYINDTEYLQLPDGSIKKSAGRH